MPQVMIICPETEKPVYTGLNLDWWSFDSIQLAKNSVDCPNCGEVHEWVKADAFLKADGGES